MRSDGGDIDTAIRARRMVRAFNADRIPDDVIDELLDLARRAPSAGNTQAVEFLILTGGDTDAYWHTTLGDRRAGFRFPGLLAAPVLVVPYVRPQDYVDRYGEDDKAATGLGAGRDDWTVPYWWVDGGAAVQNLLLAVAARGLGACFFGQFAHESAVRSRFGVPGDRRALGTVALGHPAPDEATTAIGRSAGRARRELGDVVHRGRW